jgi:predicted O-linked N-acetylglucosamine transferase (SPINDLY family)
VADVTARFAEAVRKHQAGDVAGAEELYRAVVRDDPSYAPAWCNLGVLQVKAGRPADAEQSYLQALAAVPGQPDAHFNLGNLYRRLGRFHDAGVQYLACLKADPRHTNAGFNLGLSLVSLGDLVNAVRCFQDVLKIDPNFHDAYGRLGDTYLRSGKTDDAIAAFQQYIARVPDDPRGPNNLALALSGSGKYAEAMEILQSLIRKHPGYAEAHNTLAVACEALGRKDEALTHYEEAVRLKPEFSDAWSNRGINLMEQGQADEAVASLRKSLEIRPDAPAIHSNLLLALNYSSRITPAEVAAEHRNWGERFGLPVPASPIPRNPSPNRTLNIGYVSSDYRNHTVASFIELLLRHHDRSQFRVTAYPSVFRPDDTTARLKTLADDWKPIAGLSDEQAADQIAHDNIDVLVDLGGHTAGNRLLAFAHRPAPIQLTVFGYPNGSGLAAMDYRVSDAVSDPPGRTDSLYVEKILRLPDLAWAYQPPTDAPDPGPLPSESRRSFTFGCLNNAAKISDACLSAWSLLLNGVPGSTLVLLAGQSDTGANRLWERFKKAGLDKDRVEMVFRLPRDQYFEAYQLFDFTLDPFPYNGGVTTCDSLWMGVPVLAVEGETYVSRQGLAVQSLLGMAEFVAKKPEGLLEIARAWQKRKPELATIRAGLRAKLAASSLADAKRYVRNLERSIRNAWIEKVASG